jgi:hypothetical protein
VEACSVAGMKIFGLRGLVLEDEFWDDLRKRTDEDRARFERAHYLKGVLLGASCWSFVRIVDAAVKRNSVATPWLTGVEQQELHPGVFRYRLYDGGDLPFLERVIDFNVENPADMPDDLAEEERVLLARLNEADFSPARPLADQVALRPPRAPLGCLQATPGCPQPHPSEMDVVAFLCWLDSATIVELERFGRGL